jgi:hypothetical protein
MVTADVLLAAGVCFFSASPGHCYAPAVLPVPDLQCPLALLPFLLLLLLLPSLCYAALRSA